MAQTFDLSATFVHLRDGGDAEPVNVTPAFWSSSAAGYDRLVGAFDFPEEFAHVLGFDVTDPHRAVLGHAGNLEVGSTASNTLGFIGGGDSGGQRLNKSL